MPENAGKPTQTMQGDATPPPGERPRKPDVSPTPATSPSPVASREPAWARLRLAAGIAAAVGLVAGEVLNELRRLRRLPRRA